MKFIFALVLALVGVSSASFTEYDERCVDESTTVSHVAAPTSVVGGIKSVTVSSAHTVAPTSIVAIPVSAPQVHTSSRSVVLLTSTVTAARTSSAAATSKAATVTSSTKATTASASPTAAAPIKLIGGKRGLGFNDVAATLPFAGAVSWAYNWDSKHGGSLAAGTQFVPMLWGTAADHTTNWVNNANAAIAAGSTHLLGFNEPDLGAQSNLSPQAAADAWKKYMQPFAGKAKLVSPAITNGGAPMGTAWLDAFLTACNGCTIDAIAIHIYDSATNAAYFKAYISDVGKKYGKPVWVTEFGASGSVQQQSDFLKDMVPFLNNLASVERFAYFGDFEGTFVQNGKLLPLGSAYASA